MSTPLRDESPGYHHVVARGNNKSVIYTDDEDRKRFLALLRCAARRFGWSVHAYCLMGNHYHLVMQIADAGISRGMCLLNTGYAVTFNKEHARINHLFGRRYWSRRITTDASLLNVIRYIVQNPQRAGGSKPLEGYRWTSYAATIGLAFADIQLARDELLALFGRTPADAVDGFRAFCSAAVPASPVPWQPP